jgi:hypothetical protein
LNALLSPDLNLPQSSVSEDSSFIWIYLKGLVHCWVSTGQVTALNAVEAGDDLIIWEKIKISGMVKELSRYEFFI